MTVLRHVICYDISDDRRRRKVATLLEGVGDRVQGSVFEADLDATLFETVKERLDTKIDHETDSVSFYRLCSTCAKRTYYSGGIVGTPLWGEEVVIVV
jgi:CRISPR-associated protein Cas2